MSQSDSPVESPVTSVIEGPLESSLESPSESPVDVPLAVPTRRKVRSRPVSPRLSTRLADQVRHRLREELERTTTERELAELLTKSQSWISHRLTGRVTITLDDLEAFCFGLNVSPVEVVRDRGLDFVAEMTPSESRLFTELRRAPEPVRAAILTLLNLKPPLRKK